MNPIKANSVTQEQCYILPLKYVNLSSIWLLKNKTKNKNKSNKTNKPSCITSLKSTNILSISHLYFYHWPEWNVPTDGAPEDLSGGSEVDRTMGRLGVHSLAKKPHVLHLLANQTTGDTDLLAPNHHNLLTIQKLLRNDRSETTKHVVAGVHHHALRANPWPRNHLSLTEAAG